MRIISAVNRVEFINDRMSYIILRGRWFHIIVLNVHALTEDKTEDVKDSFYEELRMGKKRNMYSLCVGNPEGKKPLGISRRRWVDYIKIDHLEIGLSVVDWICLAQDR
jgi:hypothetical protein